MPISEKKVNKAVEAFEWLDDAQESFNEAFNELNEAEQKEFFQITGASINSKNSIKEGRVNE